MKNAELISKLTAEIGAYTLVKERNKQQLLLLEKTVKSKETIKLRIESVGAIAELSKVDYFLEQNIIANERAILRLQGRLQK